jgi:hypothetical protein
MSMAVTVIPIRAEIGPVPIGIVRRGINLRWIDTRSREHVVDNAFGNTRFFQPDHIGGTEKVNGSPVAQVAQNYAVADPGAALGLDVIETQRVAVDHLVINGGGNSADLDAGVIGFFLGT